MPYQHTYECIRCRDRFSEVDDDPNLPHKQGIRLHCEVADSFFGDDYKRAQMCFSQTKYIGTKIIVPVARAEEKKAAPVKLSTLAINYWASLKDKPGMICVARAKVSPYSTGYGKAGHDIAKSDLAGNLGDNLPPSAAVQEWTSDNCAEVQAAHKVLEAQEVDFGKSGGIEFYALDSQGKYRPPCLNCQKWIGKI